MVEYFFLHQYFLVKYLINGISVNVSYSGMWHTWIKSLDWSLSASILEITLRLHCLIFDKKFTVSSWKFELPQIELNWIFSIINFEYQLLNNLRLRIDLDKLGNDTKISKLGENAGQYPVFPSEISLLY